MRGMKDFTDWGLCPPPLPEKLLRCISTNGSLTEYLQATGRRFEVSVLSQGTSPALPDEQTVLQVTAKQALYARHVCLSLDGEPVVLARSVCLQDCPQWQSVLDRGNRSLGLSLFGGLEQLQRDALQYAQLSSSAPLYQQLIATACATPSVQALPARRCTFWLASRPLLVCETFLPNLESLL